MQREQQDFPRRITSLGYVLIKVGKGYPGTDKNGWMLEHRYKMGKYLGRHLEDKEEIHHINHDKQDNKIQNLILCANHAEHLKLHVGEDNANYNKHWDLSDRVCYNCGSNKTIIKGVYESSSNKTPYPLWKHVPWDKINFYCSKCYRKLTYKKK